MIRVFDRLGRSLQRPATAAFGPLAIGAHQNALSFQSDRSQKKRSHATPRASTQKMGDCKQKSCEKHLSIFVKFAYKEFL